jgi:hypothetical protein
VKGRKSFSIGWKAGFKSTSGKEKSSDLSTIALFPSQFIRGFVMGRKSLLAIENMERRKRRKK